MTRKERWILSEWKVARDRVSRYSETLLEHRLETPFAEVDLVFRSRDHLVIVEVKSAGRFGDLWHTPVISKKQIWRLEKACEFLSLRKKLPVRLLIAVVSQPDQSIEYFEPSLSG